MSVTKPRGIFSILARISNPTQAFSRTRTGSEKDNSSPIRMMLASQMAKARRNGGWFRLNKLERGILSLAIQIKAKFESDSLVKSIVSILLKLKEICAPGYQYMLRGAEIARAFSEAAFTWGHTEARSWMDDHAYALFLGRFVAAAGRRP